LLDAGGDGGVLGGLDDDGGPEVVAPDVDGDQDGAGEQDGLGQRGDDFEQDPGLGAAVDAGAFEEFGGDLVEEPAEDEDEQRLRGGGVGEDQRPPGVEQVQFLDGEEQGDEGEGGGDEQERDVGQEQQALAAESELGERVGAQGGGGHADEDRGGGDDDGVDQRPGDAGPGFGVVLVVELGEQGEYAAGEDVLPGPQRVGDHEDDREVGHHHDQRPGREGDPPVAAQLPAAARPPPGAGRAATGTSRGL
jgi:hypothetical protein